MLQKFVESVWFQRVIIGAIILNAVTLGLETAPELVGDYMATLRFIDKVFLLLFTAEIILKLYVYRTTFFRNGWNNFDFIIVAVSWLPFIESLSVLRSLRILRVLRLISVVPQFRKVTQAFFDSLAGLATIGTILLLVFYVGAVMSTKLFGQDFPEWFGTVGASFYTLFQIMTLESWSMGIVRPVMEVHPYAWLFFVPFILVTTFATLNLLIGVIVNSMQSLHDDSTEKIDSHLKTQDTEQIELRLQIKKLQQSLEVLEKRLENNTKN
jgi:voltage-gated sodium channel